MADGPTKDELLEDGIKLMARFCKANGIPDPLAVTVDKETWAFPSTCAYYRPVEIHICVPRCAAIGRGGPAWSYPGYVVDRTPYGVIQHELGHHVDHRLSTVKGKYGGDFSSSVRQRSREERLTSYCPNDWEWFAEMFRLFVTNPDLLKAVRPGTHYELSRFFVPVVTAPWREVLRDAPQRTIDQAAKKAGETDD